MSRTGKLSATAKDVRALVLRIAKPGEVLGLQATVTNEPYELTVETSSRELEPTPGDFAAAFT